MLTQKELSELGKLKKGLIEEAREEAQKIIEEAKREAEELFVTAKKRIEEEYRKKLEQAREEANRLMESRLTGIRLDLKKEELARKQRILSEFFERLKERLLSSSPSELANLYKEILKESGLGENDEAVLTLSEDLKALSPLLKKEFKRLEIRTENGKKGYARLRRRSMETDISIDSIVSIFREKMEGEIARELFHGRE